MFEQTKCSPFIRYTCTYNAKINHNNNIYARKWSILDVTVIIHLYKNEKYKYHKLKSDHCSKVVFSIKLKKKDVLKSLKKIVLKCCTMSLTS